MSYLYSLDYTPVVPSCCYVPFLMGTAIFEARKNDHETWWCPACGATRYFPAKSDNEKLQEQLAAARRLHSKAESERRIAQRQVSAQKAAKTRLLNRVKKGVCPCCNRYFDNLHRHMTTKHKGDVTLKTIREVEHLTQTALAKLLGIPVAYISNYERKGYTPPKAKAKLDNHVKQWITKNDNNHTATSSAKTTT